jgi:hypothetical protein
MKPRLDDVVDFAFFDPGGLNLAISQMVLTGAARGPAAPLPNGLKRSPEAWCAKYTRAG